MSPNGKIIIGVDECCEIQTQFLKLYLLPGIHPSKLVLE
jgi:hypothetical protein